MLVSINSGDFRDEPHRKLFQFIELFYRKYSNLPKPQELTMMVSGLIRDLPEKKRDPILRICEDIFQISSQVTNRNLYLDITKEHIAQSRFQRALLEAAESGGDISRALKLLSDAAKIELIGSNMSRFRDLSRLDNAIHLLRKSPTGYNHFDDLLGGGVLVPSLTVFAGKPFVGKTLMLTNIAKNYVKDGRRALYYSMELPSDQINMRVDSALLGTRYQDAYSEKGIKKTKEQLQRMMDETTGDFLCFKYPAGVTVGKLAIHTDIVQSVFGPVDGIFMDYLGLLSPSSKVETMYEKGKVVCDELVALSENTGIPVYAAAQLTKRSTQVRSIKDLNEGDIAESWGIQQVAYNVCLMDKATSMVTPKMLCKWVKNRSGGQLGVHSMYEVKDTFTLVEDINEFFAATERAGHSITAEIREAMQMESAMPQQGM